MPLLKEQSTPPKAGEEQTLFREQLHWYFLYYFITRIPSLTPVTSPAFTFLATKPPLLPEGQKGFFHNNIR